MPDSCSLFEFPKPVLNTGYMQPASVSAALSCAMCVCTLMLPITNYLVCIAWPNLMPDNRFLLHSNSHGAKSQKLAGFVVYSPYADTTGKCNSHYHGCCTPAGAVNCFIQDCWCDALCSHYNDCCADFGQQETTTSTCSFQDSCLSSKVVEHKGCCKPKNDREDCFTGTCYCDQDCHHHGDCCSDILWIECNAQSILALLLATKNCVIIRDIDCNRHLVGQFCSFTLCIGGRYRRVLD